MRKWNLIIIVCLVILAFAHSASSGQVVDANAVSEPNVVVVDISDTETTIVVDSNLIKAGDGFTVGISMRTDAGAGQGSTLVDIGYIYGVAQFYIAGDVEKQKYFRAMVEFESRDLAERNSTYGLSAILLMFTPESYQVTGVAGFGYEFADEVRGKENEGGNNALTAVGINVRFNEDKNFCFTGRLISALDGSSGGEIGARIKF